MAAGRGERLGPLSEVVPKALVQIGGKPLVQWAIEHLLGAGITPVVVAVGWLGERVKTAIEDLHIPDVTITEVRDYEEGPLHTLAGALELTESSQFTVMPVDAWMAPVDLRGLSMSADSDLTLAVDTRQDCGYPVYIDEKQNIISLGTEVSDRAERGSSAMAFRAGDTFRQKIYDSLGAGENHILPVISGLKRDGGAVRCYLMQEAWFDIDDIPHVLKTNGYVLSHFFSNRRDGIMVPPNDVLETGDEVEVSTGIVLEESVHLKGPVFLAEECRISEGCRIGPNVSLGNGTVVGPQSSIQDSIIFGRSLVEGGLAIQSRIMYDSKVYGG
ncbi:MAG: NTP transferase domain-containing protein [Candidatus Thorarchaeota archaeon]